MPRGLSASQIGATEAMVATYGPFIWEHSNNVQVRHGDPIRTLDFPLARQHRGMTDHEMAAMLGLTRDQVLQIRVMLEARSYNRRRYFRQYELGGNRRFRGESEAQDTRDPYRAEAMALREMIRCDPAQVRKCIEAEWWADDTLTRWLSRHIAYDGDRKAVLGTPGWLTYRELGQKSERLANGLYRLGIRGGDMVSLQLPNIPEFLIAYLAIARLGAVMSTMHCPYRTSEMSALLKHNRSRAFIGMSRLKDFQPAAEVVKMRRDLPALDHVIALGEPVAGAVSFSELLPADCCLPGHVGAVPADPFLLLFTSGTSASPKAVPLTYQMTLGNARLAAAEYRLTADDVILTAAPYTHLLGLYSFHLALFAGAANLLLPEFSPPELLSAIERDRPSVLFTAPAHLTKLLAMGLLETADLSSLGLVIVSGSFCPPDLARAVAARLTNGRFTQLWGMTEMQAGAYTRPDDPLEIAATTVGRPSSGVEIRIADANDVSLAAGEEGELQVRGSPVFPGYFMNVEANRHAFTCDRWFRTGDLATIDQSGNLCITGRLKDIINRGGIKYNPREIEEVLLAHPKISQAAIVPFPDRILGEKACCFVVVRADEQPTLDELCAYLSERGISKTKFPERLEIIDEMPMTPTRKIIKARLKERLVERTPSSRA
jgi:cyclohexanecarboxylate-CoA ligase